MSKRKDIAAGVGRCGGRFVDIGDVLVTLFADPSCRGNRCWIEVFDQMAYPAQVERNNYLGPGCPRPSCPLSRILFPNAPAPIPEQARGLTSEPALVKWSDRGGDVDPFDVDQVDALALYRLAQGRIVQPELPSLVKSR